MIIEANYANNQQMQGRIKYIYEQKLARTYQKLTCQYQILIISKIVLNINGKDSLSFLNEYCITNWLLLYREHEDNSSGKSYTILIDCCSLHQELESKKGNNADFIIIVSNNNNCSICHYLTSRLLKRRQIKKLNGMSPSCTLENCQYMKPVVHKRSTHPVLLTYTYFVFVSIIQFTGLLFILGSTCIYSKLQ